MNIYGGTISALSYQDVGIGHGHNGEDHGVLNIYCDCDIKAGDAAPGEDTTLEDYIKARNPYINITAAKLTGTIISEGTPWIVGGVAAAAAVGVAALVIVRKKKKAA